jgi:hypothetical protein
LLKLFLHVKRDTHCCSFALFFRGLASGELKVNKLSARLPMNVFNLKEKTMMNWWSCATIEMTLVGIYAASNFVNLLSLDFCSQGQIFTLKFVQNSWQISTNDFKFLSMLLQFLSLRK